MVVRWADADLDGTVQMDDAALIQESLLAGTCRLSNIAVSNDNKLSVADLLLTGQFANGARGASELTGNGTPPFSLLVEAGDGQTGPWGGSLPDPLVARVVHASAEGACSDPVLFNLQFELASDGTGGASLHAGGMAGIVHDQVGILSSGLSEPVGVTLGPAPGTVAIQATAQFAWADGSNIGQATVLFMAGTNDCGNGTVDAGEACDDGAFEGPGLCVNDCSGLQICGDSQLNGTEDCDEGDSLPADGCDPDCQFENALCGNSLLDDLPVLAGAEIVLAAGMNPSDIAVGDFSSDGIPDLLISNRSDATLSHYEGNGDWTFTPRPGLSVPADPASLHTARLNADDFPDLILTHTAGNAVTTFLGNGDGTFTGPTVSTALVSAPAAGAPGDFDQQGGDDFAYLDASAFRVAAMRNLDCCGGLLAVNVDYTAGLSPVDILSFDYDAQQGDDLLVTNRDDHSLMIYANQGGFNNFAPPFVLSLDTNDARNPMAAAVGEVDGDNDGYWDIVTAAGAAPPYSGFVRFSLRRKGIIVGPNFVASAPEPRSLLLMDANDDTRLDIVATHAGDPGSFRVYTGNGLGNFSAGQEVLAGSEPLKVWTADFNLDGLQDFIILNGAGNTVSIIPNHRLGERCDDGNRLSGDGCDQYCRPEPPVGLCGDSMVNAVDEDCDDGGNADDNDDCRVGCLRAFCGDGVLKTSSTTPEECDQGLANDNLTPDACREDCTWPVCGDGVIDPLYGEECDNGPSNSDTQGNACRTTCVWGHCGDGAVDSGEECDDGNSLPGDGCDPVCELETPPVVPDTGLSYCYDGSNSTVTCPGVLGAQDGAVIRSQPSFTNLHSNTVLDNNTGLTWQRSNPSGTLQHWNAEAYCGSLALDGWSDWRLPSVYELTTIMDFGRNAAPLVNPVHFTASATQYWARDPAPTAVTNYRFAVNFNDGSTATLDWASYRSLRCVRGPFLDQGRFSTQSVPGGLAVVDLDNRLMWQSGQNGENADWFTALAYCEALTLGGFSDWHLPDAKELESLVDHLSQNPSINQVHFSDSGQPFWTSTTYPPSPANAWWVSFATAGTRSHSAKTTTRRARCVRDWIGGEAANGVLEPGEQCDDGGRCENGIPCLSKDDCTAAGTFNCEPAGGDGCEPDGTCTGGDCSILCGDGAINSVEEACDDGNLIPYDGCDAACQVEPYLPTPGLADTMQAHCFDNTGSLPCQPSDMAWGGQDGYHTRTPMDFSVIGDVVLDNNTGLTWERSPSYGSTYQHWTARGNCDALAKGGYDDWRLPSAIELLSIADYGIRFGSSQGIGIDTGIFLGTSGSDYWSATPSPAAYNNFRWTVGFDTGASVSTDWSSYRPMRCVRGPALEYSDLASVTEVALDRSTGLLWTRTPQVDRTWSQALSDCNGLELAGHEDWRLPDVRELSSLLHAETRSPSVDPAVFANASGSIWSSTTAVFSPTNAYWLQSGTGQMTYGIKTTSAGTRVFCVRGDYLPEPGNGFVDAGEECDDGNLVGGDGCEPDGACTDGACEALCGNGILDAAAEACDDGNIRPFDGCDPACLIEPWRPSMMTDAGQSLCFSTDAGYPCVGPESSLGGQDGHYSHRPPDYVLTGSVVTDSNTGLMWESVKSFTGTYQHWTARANCLGLVKGGYDDWRLPNAHELLSIIDYGFSYGSEPSVDPVYFPGTASSGYWTDDSVPAAAQTSRWVVRMDDGWTESLDWATYRYQICVRGPEVAYGDFHDLGPAAVDVSSGLMWQVTPFAALDWPAALSACNGLVLAGHEDWRLPDIRELASALEPEAQSPAFAFEFLAGPATSSYWSSSTRIASSNGSQAYVTHAATGQLGWTAKTTATGMAARCVRSDFLPFTGNGVLDAGEQCDDGMHCANGLSCLLEEDCTAAGSTGCLPRDGDGCENDGTCTDGDCLALCGDGRVDAVNEECDDGARLPGDGCSPDCQWEVIASVIADTGLEDCSTAATTYPCVGPEQDWGGQDGFYRRTPPSLASDGTVVHDQLTGLDWEQSPAFTSTYQWWDARDNCNGLNKGGYDDWRLPTALELNSILDFGFKYGSGASINALYFGGTALNDYWSSDRHANALLNFRQAVDFDNGATVHLDWSSYRAMRCVRGVTPAYGDFRTMRQAALDDSTGLMWTRTPGTPLNWQASLAYCNDLVLHGHADWRLPDAREMGSVITPETFGIDADVFTSTGLRLWTSTTVDDFNGQPNAFFLFSGEGRLTYGAKTGSAGYGAVCVRSNQHDRPGNGIVDFGEECDDGLHCTGGDDNGQDCTEDDRACLNGGGVCLPRSGDGCESDAACTGGDCMALCGNGRIDASSEQCDDGNLMDYDGCSSLCLRQSYDSQLPDTGQHLCFDDSQAMPCRGPEWPFGGQDGHHQRALFDLTVVGNLVVDGNMGLIWQRGDAPTTYQYGNAISYCDSLSLDGFTNWRLPTLRELQMILDYGRPNASAIDPAFIGTNGGNYWTQTRWNGSLTSMYWAVDFDRGLTGGYSTSPYHYVRCVHGTPFNPRDWRDYGPVVMDKGIGLVWQAGGDGVLRTWSDALAYCNDLELAGYSDWHLPDIRELTSLADGELNSPAVSDELFTGATNGVYWSSTSSEQMGSGDEAYVVDMSNAVVSDRSKTVVPNTALARCVRVDLAGVRGNGAVDADEECDDGNLTDGDGCESDGACTAGSCASLCGNNILDAAGEQCDDGNTFSQDGCDSACQRSVIPSALPDTGQNLCFDADSPKTCDSPSSTFGGQDGWYSMTPPNFQIGSTVAVDSHTGLTWERWRAFPGTYQLGTAYANCLGLNKGGYSDWRLPAMQELLSIADYRNDGSPALDLAVFPDAAGSYHWSSTLRKTTTLYFAANLAAGVAVGNTTNTYNDIRCVRGPVWQGAPGLSEVNASVALDGVRGLMWERGDDPTARNWQDALAYCNGLALSGYTDWRLPNAREAMSLVNTQYALPAIDAVMFPGTVATTGYWTSTTAPNSNGSDALYFDYGNYGESGASLKTALRRTKCVRSAHIPLCGNGVLDAGEECDDGNASDGDGCDLGCACELADCTDLCGNGSADSQFEECDDGNLDNSDGCSMLCLVEPPMSPLPDTGQALCFDMTKTIACPISGQPFAGQDAAFVKEAALYADTGFSSLYDSVLGVEWEMTGDPAVKTQDAASLYCAGLTLGGWTDWRLPTPHELAALLAPGGACPHVPAAFAGLSCASYWTGQSLASNGTQAWAMDLNNASLSPLPKTANALGLCLRGPVLDSAAAYSDNLDGTVANAVTGLIWQQGQAAAVLNWQDALAYCDSLALSGSDDWRLPDIKELVSFADYTQSAPAADPSFTPVSNASYWASTTDETAPASAYAVDLTGGSLIKQTKTSAHQTRCVRGGVQY